MRVSRGTKNKTRHKYNKSSIFLKKKKKQTLFKQRRNGFRTVVLETNASICHRIYPCCSPIIPNLTLVMI